jgi:hypothetical protein
MYGHRVFRVSIKSRFETVSGDLVDDFPKLAVLAPRPRPFDRTVAVAPGREGTHPRSNRGHWNHDVMADDPIFIIFSRHVRHCHLQQTITSYIKNAIYGNVAHNGFTLTIRVDKRGCIVCCSTRCIGP